jgi:hypothetical protein
MYKVIWTRDIRKNEFLEQTILEESGMRFLEHLKAVATGNKQIIVEPLYAIRYDLVSDNRDSYNLVPRFAKEYSITVKLGANQWIDEDIIKSSDGKVVEYVLEEMRHAIIDELYGELRRDLKELHLQMRKDYGYYDTKSNDMIVKIIESLTL